MSPVWPFSQGTQGPQNKCFHFTAACETRIYLSWLYRFHFDDLVKTEESRRKLLSRVEPACLQLNVSFSSFKQYRQILIGLLTSVWWIKMGTVLSDRINQRCHTYFTVGRPDRFVLALQCDSSDDLQVLLLDTTQNTIHLVLWVSSVPQLVCIPEYLV